MRLLVTIETAPGRTAREHRASGHDVVLDYAPETRVGDLAAALSRTGAEVPANVVALPGAASVPTLTGPVDLYLGDEMLDPGQTIDQSPIRHGVLLGLGGPSSQRGPEPRGLVEVRISSGPGAGHVHRLGIGRATVGHGRHCTIRIPELADDPQLADLDEALVLDVATDGIVTITPDDDVRRPGDAGAAAARAGHRPDRARGQLDQRGAEAPAAPASQGGPGVPARRPHRPCAPPYPSCTWTVVRSPAPRRGSPTRASASGRCCSTGSR